MRFLFCLKHVKNREGVAHDIRGPFDSGGEDFCHMHLIRQSTGSSEEIFSDHSFAVVTNSESELCQTHSGVPHGGIWTSVATAVWPLYL